MAGDPEKEQSRSSVVAALGDERVNGEPSHEAKPLDLADDSVASLSSKEESKRYQIPPWFLTHNVKTVEKVLGCRSKIALIARPTNEAPNLESSVDPRMSSKPNTLGSETSNGPKSSDLKTPNHQKTLTGPKSSKASTTLNGCEIFTVPKTSSVCETLKTPEVETESEDDGDTDQTLARTSSRTNIIPNFEMPLRLPSTLITVRRDIIPHELVFFSRCLCARILTW
jgi:hypothetical protein